MTTPEVVSTKIDEVVDTSTKCFAQEIEVNYQQFQSDVSELEGLAREAFQAKLQDMAWPLLEKLEEGQSLTTADQEVLKMLIVGEAKYYLQSENDVDQWRAELKRLVEEIKKQQAAGLDEVDSLMRLRALCREAMRVLPDIAYYFREKERIRKFETATSGAIDTETRRLLANLIKEMMASDQM